MPLFTLAIGLAAYAGLVGLHLQSGTLRGDSTPYALGWYSLAFAGYLLALFWAERQRRLSLTIIWSGAILFRVLLLFTTPTLSDDVYRYIWDGHVANHGVSPYAYPIDSPQLDDLDTPWRSLANNRWMASPYLPAAQYLFAALAWIGPASPLVFQGAMVLIDLGNGLLLMQLLRAVGLPVHRLLLYLWNPLVVVEVAQGAHVDTWMILLVLLALWFTYTPRARRARRAVDLYRYLAPAALALATLTKGLPLLLLAVLFWRWRWGQLLLYGLLALVLLLPSGVTAGWGLSGPLDGTGLFGAIRIYAAQWDFNSGLFHWLEMALGDGGLEPATVWAKRLIGAAMLLLLLAVWLKARTLITPRAELRWLAVPLMGHILLATTVHPWYLMLLLAFTPFLAPGSGERWANWLAVAPWLYLSWALAFSYLTYLDPLDFRELAWVRRLEWWPTWGLLLLWLGWETTNVRHA